MVLARKYRPKSFEDLVGQEAVRITLSQALANNRLSYAYLFSGLRGSGKTSTARIFAKALLCQDGPTPSPCQKCLNCQMANENRHIDIIEMDGASNRGIDDIKELIEHTKYKPSIGRFKIFIIDEVHMLTIQAFNALLKTLEEPPEFVKFILATTDPLKLPATILSRVQHFRFKKIPQKVIQSHLEYILDMEKIEYEKEAISIIARSGAGSLRDALTLLDQAIVYAKSKVDISTVTKMLGVIEPFVLDKLLEDILKKDQDAILEFISQSSEYESEMIIDELILYTKELLLKRDPRFSPIILDRFFRILAEAKELLHFGSDGEFVLGLSLMKMVEALLPFEIDQVIQDLEEELKIDKISKSLTKETKLSKGFLEVSKDLKKVSLEVEPFSIEKEKFETLIKKLEDLDKNLGEVFRRNIEFVSFENGKLTWKSKATGDEKKLLKNKWILIRTFVQDIFGLETKIINLQQENLHNKPHQNLKEVQNSSLEEKTPKDLIPEKEKLEDPILNQPMIKKAIELFDPKRVRIRKIEQK